MLAAHARHDGRASHAPTDATHTADDPPRMTDLLDRLLAGIAALAIPLGVLMLVVWTASILTIETPGWMHLLLTLGVFFVIWGVVRRGTPPPR